MLPTQKGSLRLFRFQGINVFLHWSWLLVAVYQIQEESGRYSTILWSVLEYVALFAIVLLHEFGHALACRSVGGKANQIVLWPLGGVAYVNPPRRPGATLWSIAAGPLVNVVLGPVFLVIWMLSETMGWSQSQPDLAKFVETINLINAGLLAFNLLPFYPLDGGQILRSLLWFWLGPARSLVVASALGFVGVAGLVMLAVWMESAWMGVLAAFVLMRCWRGLRSGLAMARIAKAPRRAGFACPACQTPPPMGAFWRCGKCRHIFDTFETLATCPVCGMRFNVSRCVDCGATNPISGWVVGAPVEGPVPPRI